MKKRVLNKFYKKKRYGMIYGHLERTMHYFGFLRHFEKTPRCGHHIHIVAFYNITNASDLLPWRRIIRPRRGNIIFRDQDDFKHNTTTCRCFPTSWLRSTTLFEEWFFHLFSSGSFTFTRRRLKSTVSNHYTRSPSFATQVLEFHLATTTEGESIPILSLIICSLLFMYAMGTFHHLSMG